jgi:hypothetical protein
VLILFTLWPMWVWKKAWIPGVSAALIFPLAVFVVGFAGFHHCDEGGAPTFVVFASAAIAAAGPFFVPMRRGLLPAYVALAVSAGMLTAGHLTSSYHRDDITGNPEHASGRYWHTLFTGQYPRDPKYRPGK